MNDETVGQFTPRTIQDSTMHNALVDDYMILAKRSFCERGSERSVL